MALFVSACGPSGEAVEAEDAVETNTEASSDEMTYTVDAGATTVNWEGAKIVGKTHTGTIAVSGGSVIVKDNNIVGGEFIIDMASITNEDLEAGKGKEKLEGHLKSGDFFDVEAHPTASFAIASASPVADNPDATHMLQGNLTMKGETKSITIPVKVSMEGGKLTAMTPQFTIDRTQWGVVYGSETLEGIAKDNVINDKVGLKISLTANAGNES